jgi:glycosyltransferase involved in cell wall biosynthesis
MTLPTTADLSQNDRTLMLFDLSLRGHHPNYIQQLILYWQHQQTFQRLCVVVSPNFLEEHSDVVECAAPLGKAVRFVPITQAEKKALKAGKSGIARNIRNVQEWKLCCQYAKTLKVDHCLVMYFDTYFLALATGWQPTCPFSGIYFRPTLHYGNFSGMEQIAPSGFPQWREAFILQRVLHRKRLKTVFCLDPFFEPAQQNLQTQAKTIFLPDPVDLSAFAQEPDSSLRSRLGIDADRQIFLVFGALSGRKGIFQLLDAVAQLSEEHCRRLCLLLVGESAIQAQLEERILSLCAKHPVQVVRRYEFIPDHEIPQYFKLTDIAVALYQRHVGSSGILLLAAAAQKPVIGTDYGLMGELVRRYQLGIAVDSTQPAAIATGIQQFLSGAVQGIDAAVMKDWALQNSAQKYAETIFDGLWE